MGNMPMNRFTMPSTIHDSAAVQVLYGESNRLRSRLFRFLERSETWQEASRMPSKVFSASGLVNRGGVAFAFLRHPVHVCLDCLSGFFLLCGNQRLESNGMLSLSRL